ncbi:hypothetical protein LNQ03_04045 [Klebsiella pneumoniae subsp. pneumoniae]|nr:hypothetical protein [Klebsiella pneumoniae subsp. pneumoniae]
MTITLFSAILADRLGFGEAFSEGRDAGQWLRHLYEESRPRAQEEGVLRCPRSMTSGSKGCWSTARRSGRKFFSPIFAPILSAIRSPPPSGKIELFSATVAGFGYRECPWPSVVG